MARIKKTNDDPNPLDFEATLWAAADKLRNNMDAAEYKHVVLGLIFLKCVSDAFASASVRAAWTNPLSEASPGSTISTTTRTCPAGKSNADGARC